MEVPKEHSRPTIGLLTRGIEHLFEFELWHGGADAAQDHDVNLLSFVGNDPHSPRGFDAQANVIYDFVRPEIVDGLVIFSNILNFFIDVETLKQFFDQYHSLPTVSVGVPMQGIPSIVIDNYTGMYKLVTHLITVHGYRRIAFIRGPEDSLEAEDRYRAYRQALTDYQIPFDDNLVTSGSFFSSSGKAGLEVIVKQRRLQPGEDFRAIITANDAMAITVLETLQIWGFHVPEEIAVAGFDNTMASRSITPPLTTVHIPAYDLGYQAVTLLLNRRSNPDGPDRLTMLPTFLARESCGCGSSAMRHVQVVTEAEKICKDDLSFGDALEIEKSQMLTEMAQVVGRFKSTSEWARHALFNFSSKPFVEPISRKTRTEWVARLLDAFLFELQGTTAPGSFLEKFEKTLDQFVLSGENVTPWEDFLLILRRYILSWAHDQHQIAYTENLWHQARVMIAKRNERLQKYNYLQLETRTRILREIGEHLLTVSTLEELKTVLHEGLPRLGILSAYLSLYEDPEHPDISTLLVAYSEHERTHSAVEGKRFPSVRLIPDNRLSSRLERYNFVTYPLYFRTRQLGFVLFEMSPREERAGQILCRQISSALMSVQRLEQIQIAREAAEIANEAKSEFLANMSHELRTPLNAILGFAQLIERNPQIPPEEQECLRIIQRNGAHLLTLINQVLDLAKIEAGHLALDEKKFALHHLLDDLYDMFSLKAQNKGLHLGFERDDDILQYVCTDEVKLRQVLINLLNNAIKFTNKGRVQLRITNEKLSMKDALPSTRPNVQSFMLHFCVEDTGPGIDPEEMDKLFEAFGQTETGRQAQEGTGLGLPISRKFVRLMGGDITVTSNVGVGTSVRFDIPVRVVDKTDVGRGRRIRRAIALEPGQPRYRLLIVDDKSGNRKLLTRLLEPFGFELRETQNGQEAIDVWEQWQPHLIWMDLCMPILDGYKALQRIKSSPQGKQTIVIVMSASMVDEGRIAEISAGYDGFLRKPVQDHDVLDLVHKHLGVRFVYEGDQQAAGDSLPEAAEEALSPEALAALPDALLMNLERAVMISDFLRIMELIEDVRVLDRTIADALTTLTNNFAYPKILAALQKRR